MPDLARLLDPTELDASSGPHGRMAVDVSAAQRGEAVAILVPTRLVCARCDGGGCDACGRSGGIRLELAEPERRTHVVVPKDAGGRLLVRLVRPLGDAAGLELLTVDLRVAPASNKAAVVFIVVAVLAAVAAILEWGR